MKISAIIISLSLLALSACQFSYDKAKVEEGYGSEGGGSCTSGVADATYSTVTSPTIAVVADGSSVSTVAIYLADCNSSPILGETVTITATDTGSDNIYSTCTESGFGNYSCDFTSETPESKIVTMTAPISKVAELPAEFTAMPLQFHGRICLEGAFGDNISGLAMTTLLQDNSLLPSASPYSTNPWNANAVTSPLSNSSTYVDWVLVQLLKDDPVTPGDKILVGTKSALLNKDGTLWSADESLGLSFDGSGHANTNDYYINIIHRNHLAVGSVPINLSSDPIDPITFDIDFTGIAVNNYLGGTGFKTMTGTGTYRCLVAGDLNFDQVVDTLDADRDSSPTPTDVFIKTITNVVSNFQCRSSAPYSVPDIIISGYKLSDVQLNGSTQACDSSGNARADLLLIDSNSGTTSSIHTAP